MINLNDCEPGDKLISKHGEVLTYIEKSEDPRDARFPHIVKYSDGSRGSRTDDGFVYSRPESRLDADHDITEIVKEKLR